MSAYNYFVLLGLIQLAHSQEEIWTGFHKRWFVFTISRWVFIVFEAFFSIFILVYMLKPDPWLTSLIQPIFALAMLINGIGHIVWGLVSRKYVPGLITAPLFIITFMFYYATLVKLSQG